MISKYIKKFNILLLLLIFSVFIGIALLLEKIDAEVENKVLSVIKVNANYFAGNVIQAITQHTSENLYEDLKEHPKLREKLEEHISTVVTPSFQYIYVLYRDAEGNYRYLLDGSKSDKGEFDDPLAVDEEKWNRIYTIKKSIMIKQDDINSLYVTFLRPIIRNDKVEAIVAMDFSSQLLSKLFSIISPVKQLFFLLIVVVALLLISLIAQYLSNYFIKKESMIDALTQAYNRHFLRDFFQKYQFSEYVIAMIDIDHFKKINDAYGHDVGDKALQELVKIIQGNIEKEDALVRFGGEEFLLILKKKSFDDEYHKERIKKIHIDIKEHRFSISDITLNITVSMGVVICTERYKNISEIIKKGDEKLYKAKKEGRDKIVFLDSEQTMPLMDLAIAEIKSALDCNRVFCEYQPIVCLKTNKIVKYEALVRLHGEDSKVYYPNSFLDVIANTNIYIEMTKRILKITFELIEQKEVHVSVNLNLSDILDNVIYSELLKILQEYEKYRKYLTIELLEYESLMLDIVSDRIDTIRDFGVFIALDDFGSGYSNFETIQKLNIDILKIDGSLVKNITTSAKSLAMVEAISRFSQKSGIKTVAEFISSKEILEGCKSVHIDYGQGFYLGKPKELEY